MEKHTPRLYPLLVAAAIVAIVIALAGIAAMIDHLPLTAGVR